MKHNNKKISKLSKGILFSSAAFVAVFGAIASPLLISEFKKPELNINYSNTLEGNRNRVDNFINNPKLINSSILSKSLKIYGKTGFVGNDNVELSYSERSLITIDDAIKYDLFKFDFSSSFNYSLYKNKLNAELRYIKPSNSNSSYPIVGIEIWAGEYENKYSQVYEYSENNLYGFKVSMEESNIIKISEAITKDPKSFFTLKSKIGNIGDVGIYAKNIKKDDFNFDDNKNIMTLKNNNYFVFIRSLEVDKVNPTNLKVTYDINYSDGDFNFYKSYLNATLSGFDIEQGVDDPVWKVKKFIKENKNDFLPNLSTYFKYEVPKDESEYITVEEAYKQGKFTFNSEDYSVLNKFKDNGLSVEFKEYVEGETKPNILPSKLDSTIPVYRIYITSYKGMANEYTEEFEIEGSNYEGNFKKTEQQTKMEKFNEIILENDIEISDLFNYEIALGDEFTGKQKSDIPFYIIKNAYNKFIAEDNNGQYKAPIKITIKKNSTFINNINNISSEFKQEIDSIVDEIVIATNKLDLKSLISEFDQKFNVISLNIILGEIGKNAYFNLDEVTYGDGLNDDISSGFKNEKKYVEEQLTKWENHLNSNSTTNNNLIFNCGGLNGTILESKAIELMRQHKWKEIFKSITLLNAPNIDYPEFDGIPSVSIDFHDLEQKDSSAIEGIISSKQIQFKIIISKNDVEKKVDITKTFNDLFVQK